MSMGVKAQTAYDFELNEDDSFTWEIKELNLHNFKKVFGFEPAYEVGDQMRITIRNIFDAGDGWSITEEFWDYKSDFESNGTIRYSYVNKIPQEFNEEIFLPTPTLDYLSDAAPELDTKYDVQQLTVIRRESDYTMEKEYDGRGILVSEKYVDDDGIVLIYVEGLFKIIPMGNYFIGVSIVSIAGVIFILMKRNKLQIK